MTVGAMTARVMRLEGGDSEGGDCWGSREVEINIVAWNCHQPTPTVIKPTVTTLTAGLSVSYITLFSVYTFPS